jgi:hypothetical protein
MYKCRLFKDLKLFRENFTKNGKDFITRNTKLLYAKVVDRAKIEAADKIKLNF